MEASANAMSEPGMLEDQLASVKADEVTRTFRYRYAKRAIDIALALVAVIIALPLLAFVSIAIVVSSGWPVFYRWQVVGFQGTPFRSYKFRTMVRNADQFKEQLTHLNVMNGPFFKVPSDPRITKLGWVLRRTSLDELPQLWSVLRGQMSLVGPRPPLESEFAAFDAQQARKLSVVPGLTCLWQVNGRAEIRRVDAWIALDLEYVDTWSLGLDFKLIARTPFAVLRGRGAY